MNDLNQSGHLPASEAEKPVLEFPVEYELKVILDTSHDQAIHQRNLELVLEDVAVEFSGIKFKPSRKGNYVSISVIVKLESAEQLQLLYRQLSLLPGIKMAI